MPRTSPSSFTLMLVTRITKLKGACSVPLSLPSSCSTIQLFSRISQRSTSFLTYSLCWSCLIYLEIDTERWENFHSETKERPSLQWNSWGVPSTWCLTIFSSTLTPLQFRTLSTFFWCSTSPLWEANRLPRWIFLFPSLAVLLSSWLILTREWEQARSSLKEPQ